MNTPLRLGLYGLGLVAAFGAAYLISGVVTPDSAAADRIAATEAAHLAGNTPGTPPAETRGVTLASSGVQLSPISAPHGVGDAGELAFSIVDAHGTPVLEYREEHEQELHLIVVRSDGSEFRHVHPTMDAQGVWSLPWTWDTAGSYRVFADFVPAGGNDPITLTRTIDVAGDLAPADRHDTVRETRVDGYDVTLSGDLFVGSSSSLTLNVSQDGEPVTTIQPYLGAFGHLVALREGDLAYIHVHPEGPAAVAGQASGPEVVFASEAPTAGRYLLYFDFQVDEEVHTASFVVDAASGEAPNSSTHEDAGH